LKPLLQQVVHQLQNYDPRLLGGIAGGLLVVVCVVLLVVRLSRPSAEVQERRRREELARSGRITDGVIVDARTLSGEDSTSPTPEVLMYSYRLAGVTYNCAQDVSKLAEQIIGFRIDQSVQIRYDPRNPGNSILVAETWTGLWLRDKDRESKE